MKLYVVLKNFESSASVLPVALQSAPVNFVVSEAGIIAEYDVERELDASSAQMLDTNDAVIRYFYECNIDKYITDVAPSVDEANGDECRFRMGSDRYDDIERVYFHLRRGEFVLVVTERVHWGPDGHVEPRWVYLVGYLDKPFVVRIRAATRADLQPKRRGF